jgi:aerobic-type carbon monoxide dehydrogenase small subunit (CoxS/CutS family)
VSTSRILKLHVNGVAREVAVPPQAILLDVLRNDLRLTGTKRGCDMGTCGCCTVNIDGEARLSCLTLAAQAEGRKVTTIESLGTPTNLHPIQKAYSDTGGSQCGFCTPGFIMATNALLVKTPRPSEAQVREALSGNLCRCTGYVKILEAVQVAARELAPGPSVKEEVPVGVRRPKA